MVNVEAINLEGGVNLVKAEYSGVRIGFANDHFRSGLTLGSAGASVGSTSGAKVSFATINAGGRFPFDWISSERLPLIPTGTYFTLNFEVYFGGIGGQGGASDEGFIKRLIKGFGGGLTLGLERIPRGCDG